MSKIGVGVGEDFPVDDREATESPRCSHRDARHEAWRRFRHQMHAEWHARRRAMRDALNRRDAAEVLRDLRAHHLHHLIIGGLAVIGLTAIVAHLARRD